MRHKAKLILLFIALFCLLPTDSHAVITNQNNLSQGIVHAWFTQVKYNNSRYVNDSLTNNNGMTSKYGAKAVNNPFPGFSGRLAAHATNFGQFFNTTSTGYKKSFGGNWSVSVWFNASFPGNPIRGTEPRALWRWSGPTTVVGWIYYSGSTGANPNNETVGSGSDNGAGSSNVYYSSVSKSLEKGIHNIIFVCNTTSQTGSLNGNYVLYLDGKKINVSGVLSNKCANNNLPFVLFNKDESNGNESSKGWIWDVYVYNLSIDITKAKLLNSTTTGLYPFTTSNRKPASFDVFPRKNNESAKNTLIVISTNVTVYAGSVSEVWANISIPNSSMNHLRLKLSTANRYNATIRNTNVTGTRNITFDVNDTFNNRNTSVKTIFNITLTGVTWNQTPQNKTIEFGSRIYIRLNASTNGVAISRYRVNDTTNFKMNVTSGRLQNNTHFTKLKTYFIRVTANDTLNLNVSSIISIKVNDSRPPFFAASNVSPRTVEYSYKINFSVNVSDLHSVKFVNMTINSSWYTKNFSTTKNGLRYNRSNTVNFVKLGKFTIKFYADDNSSNRNTSSTTFTIVDTIKPAITTSIPTANSVNKTSNTTFNYTTSDLFAVNNVMLIVINTTSGARYNKSVIRSTTSPNGFMVPLPVGRYIWYINSSDNSSNVNKTSNKIITIDKTAPKNVSIGSSFGCTVSQQCNFLRLNITDNFGNFSTFQSLTQTVEVSGRNYTLSQEIVGAYGWKAQTSFNTTGTKSITRLYLQDTARNKRTVTFTGYNVTVTEQGITPSGGGGGGGGATTTQTTTSQSTSSTQSQLNAINNAVISFINQYGTNPTQQQITELQTQLASAGIDLTIAELQIYINANMAISPPSIIGGGGGGGGSGIAPIVMYNTNQGYAYVIATDPEGEGASYTLLAEPGQQREKKIQLYNIGSKEVTINLKCDDRGTTNSTSGFCGFVTLSQESITLPPNELQKKYISILINNPKKNEYGHKDYFQIISTDNFDNTGSIGFGITTSRAGIIFGLLDKAQEKYTIPLSKVAENAQDAHIYKGAVAGLSGVGLATVGLIASSIAFPVIPVWLVFANIFSVIITSPIILSIIP